MALVRLANRSGSPTRYMPPKCWTTLAWAHSSPAVCSRSRAYATSAASSRSAAAARQAGPHPSQALTSDFSRATMFASTPAAMNRGSQRRQTASMSGGSIVDGHPCPLSLPDVRARARSSWIPTAPVPTTAPDPHVGRVRLDVDVGARARMSTGTSPSNRARPRRRR